MTCLCLPLILKVLEGRADMVIYKQQTCCFTGHRNLPKYEEQKVLTRVRYHLWPILNRGVKYLAVGGAVGFDMVVAEYLLDRRDQSGEKAVIPEHDFALLRFPSSCAHA